MKRLRYFLDLLTAIFASVWATISVCNPNPNPWNLLGWLFALFIVGRLLCVNRNSSESVTSPWIWRVPFAGLAVFCFTMLTMIFLNRMPAQMADRTVVIVLTIFVVLSTLFVVRLSR